MDKDYFTTVNSVEKPLGPAPVRSDSGSITLSPQRAAVLERLQHTSTTPTSTELAESMNLHPNTAREHLDELVALGFAERFRSSPQGRGRPSLRYQAVDGQVEPTTRVRDYVGLAGALAGHIQRTSKNPAKEAIEAGQQWALTEATGGGPVDEAIFERLDKLGFSPSVEESGPSITINLTRCPLLDAAKQNPDVVCNVHLGLLQGTVEQLDQAANVQLTPFAKPGACEVLLHLGKKKPV